MVRSTDDRVPWIVVGATAHWGSLQLAEHHIARALTRYAHVLFVDPPLSRMTARGRPDLAHLVDGPRLRDVDDRITVLVPLVSPGKDRLGVRRLVDHQTRRAIAQASAGRRVVATILTLPQRQLFQSGAGGQRVYWAKDDHAVGAPLYGLSSRFVLRSEQRLISRADQFLVCSEHLADVWRTRGATAPVVFPNGGDSAFFARDATRSHDPELPESPFAVFVGTLTERIDLEALVAVAERDVHVVVAGAERRTAAWASAERLRHHPRISFVGRRSYEQLPELLAAASVGLVPYTRSDYNLSSFPLKMLEYLAAGLPVVTTDLPAARWLATEHVQVAQNASSFADLVVAATARGQDSEVIESRRRVARDHDWSHRARDLAMRLGLLPSDA